MRTLFRVEHKREKIGPYTCSRDLLTSALAELLEQHYAFTGHPPVSMDTSKINPDKRFYNSDIPYAAKFAFESLNQLKSWFNERERRLLHDSKFVLAIYEENEKDTFFHPFNTQCWFCPDYYNRTEKSLFGI